MVHVVHDGGEGSPYDVRADIGRIESRVAPRDGEPAVVKGFPNSFHETGLLEVLRGLDAGPDLALAGFMTHICASSPPRRARSTWATGPPSWPGRARPGRLAGPDGAPIPAEALHAAALTTIGDLFGPVAARVAVLPD